jgi:hypothetical protein
MRILILLSLCAVTIASAAPRLVFMEEATNASCAPCAAQNPYMQGFLEQYPGEIICIRYHSNWPGPTDPMYLTDPGNNMARVRYYGVSGVPSGMIDGKMTPGTRYGSYDGFVGNVAMLDSVFRVRRAIESPCRLVVHEARQGSVVTVTMTVYAEQALSNLRLRAAAIQSAPYYANAGSNGETTFENVLRAMLPDSNGTVVTLAAGDSVTVTQSYTIASAWVAAQMFTVAWLQDDRTKNVVQAGMSVLPVSVISEQQWLATGNGAGTQTAHFALENHDLSARTLTYTLTPAFPAGWSAQFLVDGVPSGTTATMTVSAGATSSIDVSVQHPSQGAGAFTITSSDPIFAGATTVRVYRDVPALIVDGDNQIGAEEYFANAISANYRPEGVMPEGDVVLKPEMMLAFPAVVWESSKNILSSSDVAVLRSYLDAGGRLYLTGAEIAWGLADAQSPGSGGYVDPIFMGSYLHSRYVQDDIGITSSALRASVHGVAGDPIGDAIASGLTGRDILTGSTFQPDEIAVNDSRSTVIACYGTAGTAHAAAVRVIGSTFVLVYDAFGMESMTDTVMRNTYLGRILQWLRVAQPNGIFEAAALPHAIALSQAYPNPVIGSSRVMYTLSQRANARLCLIDALGREACILVDGSVDAGTHMVSMTLAAIPAGSYTLRLTAGGQTATQAVTVVR